MSKDISKGIQTFSCKLHKLRIINEKIIGSLMTKINRKSWLKILGITLENVPDKWDIHYETMIGRAAGRMYILRACKYYGMSINQLNLLFHSLIMSLFIYRVEL